MRFFFYGLLVVLLLSSCARQGAPTGGLKDSTPPVVDTSASTPNFTTRFDRKSIELRFNEWVTLSDVSTQVIVSPPFKTRRIPEVILKGKTVVVKIPEGELLRPNTTYTINFGNAVKDLHEANPAKDLRSVFSTGDFIDSLSIFGIAANAFTLEPIENVAVMLYDILSDSVTMKEKPYYYTRTDKTGAFKISNVKTGAFKLVAVDDKDQNLLWNGNDEALAFLSQPLVINDSTQRKPVNLRLFKNQPIPRLGDKAALQYGFVRLDYNAPPDSVVFSTLPSGAATLLVERFLDSALIWYIHRDTLPWKLLAGRDTVSIRAFAKKDFMKNHRPGWAGEALPSASSGRKRNNLNTDVPVTVRSVIQNPSRTALLDVNYPIMAVDTSRWMLVADSQSMRNFGVALDTMMPRRLHFTAIWKPELNHELTLLPGAITDFWGKSNTDTLRRRFTAIAEKQLGDLNLTVENLVPGRSYILQLLNGSNVETEQRFKADGVVKKLIFNKLPSGSFKAELVEDSNANGRRDSGDYFSNRQPERIFKKELPALRPNWEVEATMRADETQKTEKREGKK